MLGLNLSRKNKAEFWFIFYIIIELFLPYWAIFGGLSRNIFFIILVFYFLQT